MKKFTLIVVLLCCGYISGYSQNTPPPPPPPLMKAGPQVYGFTQKANSIELYFLQSLGNVVVTARNSSTIVYASTMFAAPASRVVIDTTQWTSGLYTIRIVDSKGSLIGEFMVIC